MKLEFKTLEDKKIVQFAKFPIFEEDEWVRYMLISVHDEFIWLDVPFKITKEAICVVTRLNSIGRLLVLKSVKNDKVTEAIGSQWDRKEMMIDDIATMDVKFSSMVIGYKIYHSSWENSISGTTIYVAYEMVKQNVDYDLCELLIGQLLENLGKIRKDKKNIFKYGNLLICLFFILHIGEVLGVGKVQWNNDKLFRYRICYVDWVIDRPTIQSYGDNSKVFKI